MVYLVHLDGQAYQEWLALFGSAFALKFLSLCHMICVQCWTDIFLVDWERPKGQQVTTVGEAGGKSKKLGNNVSIWRTYFVANEWNEIQVSFCSVVDQICLNTFLVLTNYFTCENVSSLDDLLITTLP